MILDDNFLSGLGLCLSNAGKLVKNNLSAKAQRKITRMQRASNFKPTSSGTIFRDTFHSSLHHLIKLPSVAMLTDLKWKSQVKASVYFAAASLLLLLLLFILPLLDSGDHRHEKELIQYLPNS